MPPTPIKPTNKNLIELAGPLVAGWLIDAARDHGTLAYGEAQGRLENEHGFGPIGRATRLGLVAGTLMNALHQSDPGLPLLNVLLVLQNDRLPSDGASSFLAERFGVPRLGQANARTKYPRLWRKYSELAAKEVYEYQHWPTAYVKTYGDRWVPGGTLSASRKGHEKDGIPRGRGGEGSHHKALRLWTKEHPGIVLPQLIVDRAETEVDLPSGDRVDVIYYAGDRVVALEVKSRDSNDADLTRGVFQCVKYRAVLQAMDLREEAPVSVLLVTETSLSGSLAALARRHGVRHKCVGLVENG